MVKTNKKSLLITLVVLLIGAILLVGGVSIGSKPQVDAQVKAEGTSTTLRNEYNKNGDIVTGKIWYKLINYKITNLTVTTDDSKIPQNYLEAPDVSLAEDGSLKAYVVAGVNGTYDCIIHGNVDTINAPIDSGSLFSALSSLNETNLTEIQSIVLENFNTSDVEDMSFMFNKCEKLTTLKLSSNFKTNKVKNMDAMFQSCKSLNDFTFLNSFNTTNVTDMSFMFNDCVNITTLDLTNFNTSKVEYMDAMFQSCNKLNQLFLSNNFNTQNVKNMDHMFNGCSALINLDLSMFNTSNVTSMHYMFWGNENLVNLYLSNNFNTSKVTDMYGMFENCYSLENVNLSGFNTSNVESFGFMFSGCSSLKVLDLTAFDFSSENSDTDMLGFIGINDAMVIETLQFYGDAVASLVTSYQQAIASDSLDNRIAVVSIALENLFGLSPENAQSTAQDLFSTQIQTIYAPVSTNGLNISLPYSNNTTYVYDDGSGEVEAVFLVGRNQLEELAIYPQNKTPLEKPELSSPSTPATGFDVTDFAITTTIGFVVMIAVAVVFSKKQKKLINN